MSVFLSEHSAVSGSEILWLGLLLLLALLAIAAEAFRQIASPQDAPRRQFRMRMLGGAVMLLLIAMLTFGVLFVRPEDGRIFAWYWAVCALVLLGLVLILRQDVAAITAQNREERAHVRDERLKEMQEMVERWRGLGSPEKTPAPDVSDPALSSSKPRASAESRPSTESRPSAESRPSESGSPPSP